MRLDSGTVPPTTPPKVTIPVPAVNVKEKAPLIVPVVVISAPDTPVELITAFPVRVIGPVNVTGKSGAVISLPILIAPV